MRLVDSDRRTGRFVLYLICASAVVSAFLLVRFSEASLEDSLLLVSAVTLLASAGLGGLVRHFGWLKALVTVVAIALLCMIQF